MRSGTLARVVVYTRAIHAGSVRRFAASSGHRLRDRGQRCDVAPGVGRAARAYHVEARRAVRRQGRALPGRTSDGLASHPLALLSRQPISKPDE